MRLVQQLRRLAPALLAAAVLLASLASAAHSHAPSGAPGAVIAADAQHDVRVTGADLDCALCAAASRLAHGATTMPAPAPELALQRFHAPHARDVAPLRVDLSRTEARAPPRLG